MIKFITECSRFEFPVKINLDKDWMMGNTEQNLIYKWDLLERLDFRDIDME